MEVALHHGSHGVARILHEAYGVIRAAGLTIPQAYEILRHGVDNVHEWLQQLSERNDQAAREYSIWLEQSGEMGRMAEQTRDRTAIREHERGINHRGIATGGGNRPALANSPSTTQAMTKHGRGDPISHVHGDTDNMGATGIEEGAEQQITRPKKVWRRFPNTDNAALKWIWTQYLVDTFLQSSTTVADNANESKPPKMPWDRQDYYATTDLSTTGGGAWVASTADTLGALGPGGTIPNGHDFAQPVLMQFRMTSPYNICKQVIGGGLDNINIGDSKGQPTWLEYFDTKYQY